MHYETTVGIPTFCFPPPAWVCRPAVQVAVDRFHSATVPGLLASAALGSPAARPTFMPSIPGLPLFDFHSPQGPQQVLPFADLFHHLLWDSRAFTRAFRRERFVPSRRAIGASLLPSSVKASNICSWFFCRLSPIESRRLLAAPFRLGLPHSREYYARC